MPVEAVARARLVLRNIDVALAGATAPDERRELEGLRERARAEIARYEALREAWTAEIQARRARMQAREDAARSKPIP